jgi:type I restriction enzyme S subunit
MTSEWKKYSLTDLYDVRSGLSKPSSAFGSGHPFLSFKEVFNNYFVPEHLELLVESTDKERVNCSINRGDVFLTRTSETMHELGMSSVALKDYENATFNGFTKRLRPKNETKNKIFPEFIGYALRSPRFRTSMLAFSSMSTRASLNNEMIGNLEVELPEIDTQKGIASLLSSLDKKISNNTEMNATLENIAQRIFKSWFIDFDPVKANAESVPFDGLSPEIQTLFPNEFEDSDMGIIPKGWSISSVSHICDKIVNGSTPRRSTEDFWENGDVSWFKTGELKDSFLLSSSEKITSNAVENTSVKVLPKNSVLMAIYASPTVGRLGILTEDSAFNQAATGMVPNKEIGHTFLYYILKFGRLWFNNCSSGAAQQNISKLIVENYEFMMPTKQLINQFNNISIPIFEKIKNNQRQIEVLTSMRDKLLPRLISGKITIQKAEEMFEEAS